MKKLAYSALLVLLCTTLTVDTAQAQRGRGGRDSGSSYGSRGSYGGGRPDFGGGGRPSYGGGRPDFGGSSRGSYGSYGSRGGFDPSQMAARMTSFMDRNKNGQIDPEEMARLPSSMRERMEKAGISTSRSISIDDFQKRVGDAMSSRSRGGDDGDRRGDSRDSGRGDDRRGGDSRSRGPTVFKQSERKRVTKDLPEDFVAGDANKDGQIALFEWAAWKRNELFLFFDYDSNADGFLTPQELTAKDEEKEQGPALAMKSFKRDRLTIVGPGSGSESPRLKTTAPGSDRNRGDSRDSRDSGEKQKEAARAAYYFDLMDRDKDGLLSETEWEGSRKTKPMFEKAGIDIVPMNKDTFVANYLKATGGGGDDDDDDRRGDRRDSGRGRGR